MIEKIVEAFFESSFLFGIKERVLLDRFKHRGYGLTVTSHGLLLMSAIPSWRDMFVRGGKCFCFSWLWWFIELYRPAPIKE